MTAFGMGVTAGRQSLLFGKGATGADSTTSKFIGRLLEFIPGDIVAGYVAVLPFLPVPDESYLPQWTTASVFLALAPIIVALGFIRERRLEKKAVWAWKEWPWFRLAAAPLAFAAWVFALPNSPVNDFGTVPGWLQSLVLVGTTIVVSAVAGAIE